MNELTYMLIEENWTMMFIFLYLVAAIVCMLRNRRDAKRLTERVAHYLSYHPADAQASLFLLEQYGDYIKKHPLSYWNATFRVYMLMPLIGQATRNPDARKELQSCLKKFRPQDVLLIDPEILPGLFAVLCTLRELGYWNEFWLLKPKVEALSPVYKSRPYSTILQEEVGPAILDATYEDETDEFRRAVLAYYQGVAAYEAGDKERAAVLFDIARQSTVWPAETLLKAKGYIE